MATLPLEDEDLPGKIMALPTSGGSAGGGGAPTTVGPAAAPSAAAAAPGTGTGFVNLEQYLGLNQGAGMGMADTLAGGLERDAAGVRQGVDALSGQFNDAAYAGRATPSAAYKGPTSLSAFGGEQYAKLGAQASDVAARGRQAQSGDAGTLLQGQYGQGREYGTGARGLDSFLSTTGSAGDRLRQGATSTNSLEKYLGLADKQAGDVVTEYGKPPSQTGGAESPPGPAVGADEGTGWRERRRLRGGVVGKMPVDYGRGY